MSQPTSPIAPLGAQEEGILQNYFLLLSQFACDKAKEIMERERDAHKATVVSLWSQMAESLIQFSIAEKTYMGLFFLEQKWFQLGRFKDSLRNSYQVLSSELRKITDSVLQQEHMVLGLPGPSDEFELLLAHLCGQLCEFIRARQKTMEFYETISMMGTNKNMNYEDLVAVITEIIQAHSKNFHHPILSNLKSGFTTECDSINHLLQAQILMCECQFLPSLLQLHQAHSKLTSWGSAAQARETTKKSMFGSSSKTVSSWPALYQWLLRYKCLLVAKFSLYFYDILSKQTTPVEMKTLSGKNTEDLVARIIVFQKKTDAANISLVLDTHNLEHVYPGAGYHHPDRQIDQPTGLDSYPAIFSYPGEHPVNHWPNVVMMITDRNTEQDKVHYVYDKEFQSAYFITNADPRISIVVIFDTKKPEKDNNVNNFLTDLSAMLRCVKLFTHLKPGARVGGSRK